MNKETSDHLFLRENAFTLIPVIVAACTGVLLGAISLFSPLIAVGVSLAIILILVALKKPMFLCILVVTATILTSGIERGRFVPVLSINEIILLFAGVMSLMIFVAGKRWRINLPGYFGAAFSILIVGTMVSPIAYFLITETPLTMNNAFKLAAPLQYLLLFWVFVSLPESEADHKTIIWWMLGLGALVAVIGIAQGLGIGIVEQILSSIYASSHEAMAASVGRITSILGSWNTLGIFMMSIIFLCWSALFEVDLLRGRVLIMGVMALCVLCLLMSGSYAGIIGSVIGLVFMQVVSQRKIKSIPALITCFMALVLIVLLCYPFLRPLIERRLAYQFRYGGLIPQTLSFRFQVWRDVFIPAIKEHFPWPVYPSVPVNYAWQFEESQYILLLFRTGLVGFLAYLLWIGITCSWLMRNYRTGKGFTKAITSAALTIVAVLVITGFTNEVFSFAGTIDFLWILLALAGNSAARVG